MDANGRNGRKLRPLCVHFYFINFEPIFVDAKWSQSERNFTKWTQMDAIGAKWTQLAQIGRKVDAKWTQMDVKWTQSGRKVDANGRKKDDFDTSIASIDFFSFWTQSGRKWTQNGRKVDAKWTQILPCRILWLCLGVIPVIRSKAVPGVDGKSMTVDCN